MLNPIVLKLSILHLHAKVHVHTEFYRATICGSRATLVCSSLLEFAILALASESARIDAPTLTRDISASTWRTASSFRDVIRVVVFCVPSKFHSIRPTRSPEIAWGFAPCQALDSVCASASSASDFSAHSAASELRFGEDVPMLVLYTSIQRRQHLCSRFRDIFRVVVFSHVSSCKMRKVPLLNISKVVSSD